MKEKTENQNTRRSTEQNQKIIRWMRRNTSLREYAWETMTHKFENLNQLQEHAWISWWNPPIGNQKPGLPKQLLLSLWSQPKMIYNSPDVV